MPPIPTLLLLILSTQHPSWAKSNFSRPTENVTCAAAPNEKPLPSPAILCPNPPQPNYEIIYSSYEDSFPDKECVKCSLRLSDENSTVFVRCFRCQDVFRPPTLVETDKCYNVTGDEFRRLSKEEVWKEKKDK